MIIRMKRIHGSLVVRPTGNLTERAARELLEQIQKELEPEPRDVILTMSGIESMDAGALPYLFRIQKQARAAESRFVLAGTPEPALRLFRLTNVATSLDFSPNEEEALRAPVH